MGQTPKRGCFGFSEAWGVKRNEINPVSPKLVLSNESSGSGDGGRAETEEESAKRRKFLKELDMPDLLGENGSDDEQQSEESRVPKTKRAPHEPTNDEIKSHEITHTPYRSWCPCCVAARGKSSPHSKGVEEEKAVASVHVDYWFLRDEKGGESTPVLVAKDDQRMSYSRREILSG